MSKRFDVLLVNDGRIAPQVIEKLRPLHEVRVAKSLRDVVEELLRRVPDVMVSHLELPPYRGDVLLAMVAREHPQVRRVLLVGGSDITDCLTGVAHVMLTDPEELLAAIDED
jgi:DNA-binding NtrC family response regulator